MTTEKNGTEHNVSRAGAKPRPSGITCPVCQNFIPIDVSQLLSGNGVTCSHCGIFLAINRKQSQEALDLLAKSKTTTRKGWGADDFE